MKHSQAGLLAVGAALALALAGARPYAGSWNDGSRLAAVESLVDYHTFAIDRSIFVGPSPKATRDRPAPYPVDEPVLLQHGTLDKLYIAGHYYSDKPPVPTLLLAACYQALQWATGLRALDRPDLFCYWLTVLSSGAAYVLAVGCTYRLGRTLGLSAPWCLALAGSLGVCTVALPYLRHVNGHILLLGVSCALVLELVRLGEEARAGGISGWRVVRVGVWAGLGYTFDLGTGTVLLLCTSLLVVWRCRRLHCAALFALGAAPWLLLHHAVNYAVGGTLGPANAVPEYFRWPGSPFHPGNMTGLRCHESVGSFLLYAASMLLGKRGFIGHSLPLFLTLPALAILLRRRPAGRPEILWAAGYAGGTWLLYAALSNNSSGLCCSVRWFVPLLAPGYYVLALFLRECPGQRWAFILLSAWGAALVALMGRGPWMQHMVPLFWPVQAAALLCWAVGCRLTVRVQSASYRRTGFQPVRVRRQVGNLSREQTAAVE